MPRPFFTALSRSALLALALCSPACDGSKSISRAPDAAEELDAAADADTDAGAPALAPDAAGTDAAPAQGMRPLLPGQPGLCAREADDVVRDVFCKETAPTIRSLRELQVLLSLNHLSLTADEAAVESMQVDPKAVIDTAVFMGHSTALSGRLVSPINPRAIIMGNESFMTFQRGVQQVELIVGDRDLGRLNFYLVSFSQACNQKPSGCAPGDLYTPSIERDWTAVTLRDDEDLKNTPEDCRQCHQRGRPSAALLMRELRGPWTHFFAPPFDGEILDEQGREVTGGDLARDYERAKGRETYAGVPAAFMARTVGVILQNRVDTGQPLDFDTPAIEAELREAGSGAARRSATWDLAYQAFKRGEQLALPHFEPRPTDRDKQARLSAAYARYRAKEIPAEALPDLADIFPDDPKVRAEIGLQTDPEASPAETLIQACASCHNEVLDQSISRARFHVGLSRMSRAEIDLAIARIELSASEQGVMPPPAARQLDAGGRARLIAYLRAGQLSPQDEALLELAAKVGMAKERADYPRF